MFGPLGFPELIFILVLVLLIFGPKRLPEIGRTIGKGMAEFRKASTDLKRTINTELALDEPAPPPVRPWETLTAPDRTTPRTPQPALATVGVEQEPVDTPDLPLSADEAPAAEAVPAEPLEPR